MSLPTEKKKRTKRETASTKKKSKNGTTNPASRGRNRSLIKLRLLLSSYKALDHAKSFFFSFEISGAEDQE